MLIIITFVKCQKVGRLQRSVFLVLGFILVSVLVSVLIAISFQFCQHSTSTLAVFRVDSFNSIVISACICQCYVTGSNNHTVSSLLLNSLTVQHRRMFRFSFRNTRLQRVTLVQCASLPSAHHICLRGWSCHEILSKSGEAWHLQAMACSLIVTTLCLFLLHVQ